MRDTGHWISVRMSDLFYPASGIKDQSDNAPANTIAPRLPKNILLKYDTMPNTLAHMGVGRLTSPVLFRNAASLLGLALITILWFTAGWKRQITRHSWSW